MLRDGPSADATSVFPSRCGSGSGVKSAFPELAQAMAADRMAMAEAVDAKTLVTACPWCLQSLQEASKGRRGIAVVDITEMVERSTG